jgi:hypothetical protein
MMNHEENAVQQEINISLRRHGNVNIEHFSPNQRVDGGTASSIDELLYAQCTRTLYNNEPSAVVIDTPSTFRGFLRYTALNHWNSLAAASATGAMCCTTGNGGVIADADFHPSSCQSCRLMWQ